MPRRRVSGQRHNRQSSKPRLPPKKRTKLWTKTQEQQDAARRAADAAAEAKKRAAEKVKKFDKKFIELARNVYKLNDERAKIKLAINNALGSNIKEVKSYV